MSGKNSCISAEVLADSVNSANGRRVTTFILTFPRYILAELNTHRMMSRNAASSRAIPIKKMLSNVLRHPAMPIRWGQTKKGMQDGGSLPKYKAAVCKYLWLLARYPAMAVAWLLYMVGLHKQVANRLLEPWMYITVVFTGTEWVNFYKLRLHPAAQPEFQELARQMLQAHAASTPDILEHGEWHLPFCNTQERHTAFLETKSREAATYYLLKRCTSRCARTSYANFYGQNSFEDDARLHDMLQKSGHWSPFEHCCQAVIEDRFFGNFRGFKQYRKQFTNETHDTNEVFEPKKLLAELTQG